MNAAANPDPEVAACNQRGCRPTRSSRRKSACGSLLQANRLHPLRLA